MLEQITLLLVKKHYPLCIFIKICMTAGHVLADHNFLP